jgi:hypothetical protein
LLQAGEWWWQSLQARGRWFEPSCAHPGQSVASRLSGRCRLVMTGLEGAASQVGVCGVWPVHPWLYCDLAVSGVCGVGAHMGAGFALRCVCQQRWARQSAECQRW